jgi:hypothetical protein
MLLLKLILLNPAIDFLEVEEEKMCWVAEKVLGTTRRVSNIPFSVRRARTKRPTRKFYLIAYLIIIHCINVHNLTSKGFMMTVCNVFGRPVIA